MSKRFLSLLAATFVTLAPAVQAGEAKVVVELFTSQGCSSCPPADAMLRDLARNDGVIALAYHVDYWDYLGWTDTFAQRAFTLRQDNYVGHTNREWIRQRLRGKFTPEIIVQGVDSMVGHDGKAVMARVHAHAEAMPPAQVGLSTDGTTLVVSLATEQGLGPVRVMLARYIPQAEIPIERGENAGRTLRYSHIVSELRQIGDWNGQDTAELRAEGVDLPVVVFVQRGAAGPILAVAELK